MPGVVFLLISLHLFQLKLLRANHLKKAVDLRFLLLFQLLMNFAQARGARVVVRISSCY